MRIIYNLSKLSQYFDVTDPVPQKHKSNLVYRWACPQNEFHESHLAEIEKHLEEHVIDHNKCDK